MAEGTKKEKLNISGKQIGILVCLGAMFFFAPTFTAVSSTYSLYPDWFGITPAAVSWVTSITSPLACIACLFVGAFVGTKISYRACVLMATGLFVISGGLPFIWQSLPWPALLASRAVFGFAVGCFNPIIQAVLMQMFESQTVRATLLGVLNICLSVGNTVSTTITGALALNGTWQNAYAFYLFCLIPFALAIIFMKDETILGNRDENLAAIQAGVEKVKSKVSLGTALKGIPGIAWAILVVTVFATVINRTFFGYAGIAMAESGADTLKIGLIFSAFTISGIIISALNGVLWKFLKMFNFPLGFGLLALGHLCNLIGSNTGNTTMFIAASLILGAGLCLIFLCVPVVMSTLVPAYALTACIAVQEVARNLGGFLNAPWINTVAAVAGDTAQNQFGASMGLAIVICVIAAVLAVVARKRLAAANAAKAAEQDAQVA